MIVVAFGLLKALDCTGREFSAKPYFLARAVYNSFSMPLYFSIIDESLESCVG